ncbi:MAG TPA: Fic family protein [Chthoniobacteraceae bacterium]|jgi:hypothetical protein|nr:Fic family protein [Chthoniobacteraceae bacterium]
MADHPTDPNDSNQFDKLIARRIKISNRFLWRFPLARILGPSLDDVCLVHQALFRTTRKAERLRSPFVNESAIIDSVPGRLKSRQTITPLDATRYLLHCPPGEVVDHYKGFSAEMWALQDSLPNLLDIPLSDEAKVQKLRYVAAFHARFIYIHPFENGNGRLGRALAAFQLKNLFAEGAAQFPIPAYWNRKPALGDAELGAPSATHSAYFYLKAMDAASENLVNLARFFNIYFPELKFPATLPPPEGRVNDLRYHASR